VKEQCKIRKLIFYTQPYCDMYLTRNDLLAPQQQDIAFDETVRKNLAGDVLGHLVRVSDFVSQYFIDICNSNLNNIFITELEAILSLVGITLIVGFYALILRYKMKTVYLLMFDMKVNCAHPERRCEEGVEELGKNKRLLQRAAGGRKKDFG
jgi:hypothetical protein